MIKKTPTEFVDMADLAYTQNDIKDTIEKLKGISSKMPDGDAKKFMESAASLMERMAADIANSEAINRNINCCGQFTMMDAYKNKRRTVEIYGSTDDIDVIAQSFAQYELVRQVYLKNGGSMEEIEKSFHNQDKPN